MKHHLPLVLLLALVACTAEELPAPPPPTNTVYDADPNLATCSAGALKNTQKQEALTTLNSIRARHGLPAVSYDSGSDAEVTAAALIMAANNTLTHSPASSLDCYTSAGFDGAQVSNLYIRNSSGSTLSTASSVPVEAFLIDDDVSSLGHRRWLLDPFLSSTAFGRVDGTLSNSTRVMTSALKVIGTDADISGTTLDFVAYPHGDYPSRLVDESWFLSFSVVASRLSRAGNDGSHVSFAGSNVQVFNSNLDPMTVSDVSAAYDGVGLPNHLQWKVAGLVNGVQYTVQVNNVNVNGELRNYQYTFRLM